jgi:hypothetical protein
LGNASTRMSWVELARMIMATSSRIIFL